MKASFHQFIPLARDKTTMKQCSKTENYNLIYDFSIWAKEKPVNFLFQMFVASATIKFGLAWSWKLIWRVRTCTWLFHHIHFTGRKILRICFVPLMNILYTVDVPTTANSNLSFVHDG